ncbi:MAG: GNAT family N-acetyltransferase [Chloroflexota bacterium]|nr:MAG: GNAT family N-acetyltransferase [Chloroflexota bacterium]
MIFEAKARPHYGTLWALDYEQPTPRVREALVPAVFTWLGPETILTAARVMDFSDPAGLQRRFSSGRRCLCAVLYGKIAAYGWVTFDEEQIGEMGMVIRLKPGEAYIWDCVTLPQYRRKGFYTALLTHVVAGLRQEGIGRIWIGTDLDNVPSLRGIARAGFSPVVDIAQTGSGGLATARFYERPGASDKLIAAARQALATAPGIHIPSQPEPSANQTHSTG